MLTIPSLILAVVYLCAGIIKLKWKHYDDTFSRLLLFGVFLYLAIFPDTDLLFSRAIVRYFTFLLPAIEILSWTIARFIKVRL